MSIVITFDNNQTVTLHYDWSLEVDHVRNAAWLLRSKNVPPFSDGLYHGTISGEGHALLVQDAIQSCQRSGETLSGDEYNTFAGVKFTVDDSVLRQARIFGSVTTFQSSEATLMSEPNCTCEVRETLDAIEALPVDPLFQFHRLNPAGIEKAQRIAFHFSLLLQHLSLHCPVSTREFAIVKTKLEEAAFFAKKSMANDPSNQEAV